MVKTRTKVVLAVCAAFVVCFVVCVVMARSSSPRPEDFPDGYEKYHLLLGEKRDVVLSSLELEEDDLVPVTNEYRTNLTFDYAIPGIVNYHGIPFRVVLGIHENGDYLVYFKYEVSWEAERENAISTIRQFAGQLEKDFGRAFRSVDIWDRHLSDIKYLTDERSFTDMRASEIDEALRQTTEKGNFESDYWILGELEEEERRTRIIAEMQRVIDEYGHHSYELEEKLTYLMSMKIREWTPEQVVLSLDFELWQGTL